MLGNKLIKILCTHYIERLSAARLSSKIDPGTRRRVKIVEDSEEIDVDDLDYEANFEAFNRSHTEHVKELKAMKDKLQYDIVKKKYFKNKYPNFLTWHDKEQIRLLHKKDPEEWNITRLSEGFPALPEIIKNIIKSNWRMDNVERMKRHDEKVRENWRKLKNNELGDLPHDLLTHLKKFSSRKENFINYDKVNFTKIEYKPELTTTEFSDIISSYKEIKEKKKKFLALESAEKTKSDLEKKSQLEKKMENIRIESPPDEDTFLIEPLKNPQLETLETFRNKLQKDLERGKKISVEDTSIIELNIKEKSTLETTSSVDLMDYTKYNTGKLMVIDEKKPKDYDHLVYPEKIKIPRKILKRGLTYKLNDCFYDSDGKFLYRVPGM